MGSSKIDPRIENINELILNFSGGHLKARAQTAGKDDELDAIITGLNMLGEELYLRIKQAEDGVIKLRQAQSQMIEAEKMTMLGTVVAGTAHELRNPLMGILNYVQYCQKDEATADERKEYLGMAESEAGRCSKIIDDLMRYAHQGDGKKKNEKIQLQKMLPVVLALLKFRLDRIGANVQMDIPKGLSEVACVPGDLEQVFLNLVANAVDAMEEASERKISIKAEQEKDVVVVTLADTGTGIEPQILQQIWTPFFTTKDPGVGTGLGLSNVKSMLTGMGADIEVQSEVGKGSQFTIKFKVG